jgi:YggT family protein
VEGIVRETLHYLITGLTWFIILGALLTFIPPHQRNGPINRVIKALDSLLSPIRKLVPPIRGIDLSPLVAIILLQVIDSFVRGI